MIRKVQDISVFKSINANLITKGKTNIMDSLNTTSDPENGWFGFKNQTYQNRPQTVSEILEATVEKYPDVEGFIGGDRRLTYREFNTTVNQIASGLQQHGVKKGDHIALLLGIQVDFPLCFFALMKIGAIAVPLNTRFKSQELSFEINDSESTILIVDEEYWSSIEPVRDQLSTIHNVFLIGNRIPAGTLPITELTQNQTDSFTPVAISESDDAMILYTSGTTGKPKGAILCHHGLVLTAMLTNHFLKLENGDKMICCVPLFHVTGLAMSMLSHIYSGIPGVYIKKFKTKDFLKIVAVEKATHYIGVANIIWLMINHSDFSKYDFSFLKKAMVGGSPVTEEMVKKIKEKLPDFLMSVGYGLTESNALITTTPYQDALRKIKAVGKLVPLTEIKIVDDSDNQLPSDCIGEILLRGAKIIKKYWNNPEATRTTIVNGWLHTGDIGKIDSEGFIYILDRKKDMINRGGEKIYSQEVENLIFNYPKVIEVAVVGVPDKVMGEAVKAVIVLKPGQQTTEEEIRTFCTEHLADFKVPKYIEFMENLPRNSAGKLTKFKLRYIPSNIEKPE